MGGDWWAMGVGRWEVGDDWWAVGGDWWEEAAYHPRPSPTALHSLEETAIINSCLKFPIS